MKAKEFAGMIRAIVAEELRRQLPGVIAEVLSERYLSNMLAEQVSHLRPLKEEQEEVEERPAPVRKNPKSSVVARLMEKNDPLAFVYEGVQPIPADSVAPQVEISEEPEAENVFHTMSEIVRRVESAAPAKREILDPQVKMREIEARRKALEVPVNR